jgi:simple sugar transport system permease protein
LKTNEIIVSLMMNYIAILLLEYLVYGVWKDPTSFGFPMTPSFSEAAVVGKIGTTSINWGLGHCFVLGVLVWGFSSIPGPGLSSKRAEIMSGRQNTRVCPMIALFFW